MENHIMHMLSTDHAAKYKNNVQFPKKQYPLNKHPAKDTKRIKHLTKKERLQLISNINDVRLID